jgi:hypothetical protein
MRHRTTTTGALAALTAAGLTGLTALTVPAGSASAAPTGPTTGPATGPVTVRERGIVLECTGSFGHRPVYTSLYENDQHGNVIQVLVGRDGHRVGGSRGDADGFLYRRHLRGAMQVAGSRAVVSGTARGVGDAVPVSEEIDDAGQHITSTGTHRSLATHLRLTWKGRSAPLTCGTAFRYDLRVTTASTTG